MKIILCFNENKIKDIQQSRKKPYNYVLEYLEVLLGSGNAGGITCSHLSKVNKSVCNYIVESEFRGVFRPK